MSPIPRSIGTLAGAVLAALILAAPAAALDFAPAQTHATGGYGVSPHETSTAAADFDRDGDTDVAIADGYGGTGLRILRNNGTGGFPGPATQVSLGFAYGTVLAGEVTGDPNPDLIATNFAQVKVLRGNGNGGFTQIGSYVVPQGGQEDAELRDFTGDDKVDIAVLTRYGVQLLRGTGGGAFANGPASYLGTPFMSGIDNAKLNGDGAIDLVAADAAAQQLYRLVNDGTGRFTLQGSGTTAIVPGTALAGDLNEDGIDDGVGLNEFNVPGTSMAVLLSNGSGGFAPATYIEGGYNPVSGELADLDADGHLDVISSDTTGSRQVVQLGDGDGGFTLGGGFATAFSPQTPVVADFDGDGSKDIAVSGLSVQGFGAQVLSVLLNDG